VIRASAHSYFANPIEETSSCSDKSGLPGGFPNNASLDISFCPLVGSDAGIGSGRAVASNSFARLQRRNKTDYRANRKAIEAWSAHDIDGYMAPFWKSPLLIYVVDSEVLIGWDGAYGMVRREFPNAQDAGNPVLERLQVNVISADAAVSVEWWTVHFRGTDVHGNTSSAWKKFPEGWRTIECHTSSSEFSK
jgi:Protein of unknown function (DUF3225)